MYMCVYVYVVYTHSMSRAAEKLIQFWTTNRPGLGPVSSAAAILPGFFGLILAMFNKYPLVI